MDQRAISPARAGDRVLPQLPQRLHHHAFVVRDQEVNRRFFENVLGLPLVATWCEKLFNPEAQREIAYCHTFFGLADGAALAFFQFADDAMYERTRAVEPPIGRFQHVALKVDRATFDELDRRVTAAGIARPHHRPEVLPLAVDLVPRGHPMMLARQGG